MDIVDSEQRGLVERFHALLAAGCNDQAIYLELAFYNKFVKSHESVSSWDFWNESTYLIKRDLALHYRKSLTECNAVASVIERRGIAVVFHNYSGLAHELQVLRAFRSMREHGFVSNVSVVYVFGSGDSALAAHRFWGGVATKVCFLNANTYTHGFYELSQFFSRERINIVFYPSIYFLASWASIFAGHLDQRFYVMKYMPRLSGGFSCWSGGLGKGDMAAKFSSLPFFELPVFLPAPAILSRDARSGTRRFGSISRVEKMSSRLFWDAVVQILDTVPGSEFLITVKEEEFRRLPGEIRSDSRIVNLGWVDPGRAISEFDVYLEPFPWGGGEMSFLAISSGVPYVALRTAEMYSVGPMHTIDYIESLSDGGNILGLESDQNSFVDSACRLLLSHSLQQEVSTKWFKACREYESRNVGQWEAFFSLSFPM